MPDAALSLLDRILARGNKGVRAVVSEVRRQVKSLARQSLSPDEMLSRLRKWLAKHEPILSRVISDTMLASWVAGFHEIGRSLPTPPSAGGVLPPTRPIAAAGHDSEPPPVIRFPALEAAARDLLSRDLVTRPQFDAMADDARRAAFTIARVASLAALDKARAALADVVSEGGTRGSFGERLREALDGGSLSPDHLDTVFRTNVMSAYTIGLNDVLDDPYVRDEFPFCETVPIIDARLSELCAVASKGGMDGTGVYLRDDPEWLRLMPPRHHRCRCGIAPLSIEDAAKKGVKYARHWLETGIRPAGTGHVERVPVELPKGWVASGRMEARI